MDIDFQYLLKFATNCWKESIIPIFMTFPKLNIKSLNHVNPLVLLTLLIFSLGCVRSAGKCERASQLRTTCVCSSVPVTMFPTALRAAVCKQNISFQNNLFFHHKKKVFSTKIRFYAKKKKKGL